MSYSGITIRIKSVAKWISASLTSTVVTKLNSADVSMCVCSKFCSSPPVINILSEGDQMFHPALDLLTRAGAVLSCGVKILKAYLSGLESPITAPFNCLGAARGAKLSWLCGVESESATLLNSR